MKMVRWARLSWVVLLAVLMQTSLLMADDQVAGEGDLSRVRKKVEALRAWQLTEELNLDEETSSQLFPAMREADEERWRIEANNRKLVREMSRMLEEGNADPQRIDRILDDLQANRRQLAEVEERHMERVRRILSPVDAARYLVFQIKFQKEIRQKAAQAFRDRRRPGDDGDTGKLGNDNSMGSGRGGSGGGSGSGSGGGSSGGGGSGGRR